MHQNAALVLAEYKMGMGFNIGYSILRALRDDRIIKQLNCHVHLADLALKINGITVRMGTGCYSVLQGKCMFAAS